MLVWYLIAALCLAVIYLSFVQPLLQNSRNAQGKPIPGPSFTQWLFVMLKSRLSSFGIARVHGSSQDLISQLFERHGPFFKVSVGSSNVFFIADPELAKSVLNSTNFAKISDESGVIRSLATHSLLLSEGESWHAQREVIARAFSVSDVLQLCVPVIEQECLKMIDFWQDRGLETELVVDMHKELTSLAFSIILRCGFGVVDDEDAVANAALFATILHEMQNPWRSIIPFYDQVPSARNKKYKESLESLKALVLKIIAKRKSEDADENTRTLVDALIDAELDDSQIQDNVMSFLLAGHETESSFLAFTLYLLATHPDWQKRARNSTLSESSEELVHRSAMDNRDADLMTRVLKEALRLWPPAPTIGRTATKEVVLEGNYIIPQGSMVMVSVYGMHRSPDVWDKPDEFNPDRFLTRAANSHWMPFSAGLRTCIGAKFSMMEAKIVLSTLLRHFDFSPVAGRELVVEQMATLRPRGGLPLLVKRLDANTGMNGPNKD